jgi:plasmid stability protein
MAAMPTLHLRNVPAGVYERLRRQAKQNGRSMNAEVIALLKEAVERKERASTITDELRRLAYKINLPEDAAKPEQIIREIRDAPPRGL